MANHFENIDRYFGGDMSAEEMQQLENTVAQDPLLEKEFSFQQELVEGIQAARKAELKAILSNVDVTGAAGVETGVLTKILGGVAAIGILAVGAYFYFGEEAAIATDNIVTTETSKLESASTTGAEVVKETTESTNESKAKVEATDIAEKTSTLSEEGNEASEKTEVVISEASVKESFEDENEASEIEAPINHLIAKSKVTYSTLEVSVEGSKRYSFHYQVKNNVLSLYGDFSDIYEIIEFHKDGNTTTYFKYVDKYYEIDKLQSKATPLVELTGDGLLTLLDNIENNKER